MCPIYCEPYMWDKSMQKFRSGFMETARWCLNSWTGSTRNHQNHQSSDSFDGVEVKRAEYFTVARCANFLAQISSAVDFLHRIKIVHRDLSPGNCFLTKVGTGELQLKIGDFGQSFIFKEAGKLPEPCGGTPGYFPRYPNLKINKMDGIFSEFLVLPKYKY